MSSNSEGIVMSPDIFKWRPISRKIVKNLLRIVAIRLQEPVFHYKPKGYTDMGRPFETWLCSQECLNSNPWRAEDEECDGKIMR
jgi:hypothetical protein